MNLCGVGRTGWDRLREQPSCLRETQATARDLQGLPLWKLLLLGWKARVRDLCEPSCPVSTKGVVSPESCPWSGTTAGCRQHPLGRTHLRLSPSAGRPGPEAPPSSRAQPFRPHLCLLPGQTRGRGAQVVFIPAQACVTDPGSSAFLANGASVSRTLKKLLGV